jgi:hypothetical protein
VEWAAPECRDRSAFRVLRLACVSHPISSSLQISPDLIYVHQERKEHSLTEIHEEEENRRDDHDRRGTVYGMGLLYSAANQTVLIQLVGGYVVLSKFL